jgi:hypothetical protein
MCLRILDKAARVGNKTRGGVLLEAETKMQNISLKLAETIGGFELMDSLIQPRSV